MRAAGVGQGEIRRYEARKQGLPGGDVFEDQVVLILLAPPAEP